MATYKLFLYHMIIVVQGFQNKPVLDPVSFMIRELKSFGLVEKIVDLIPTLPTVQHNLVT